MPPKRYDAIDSKTIDNLIGILTRIKANGGIVGDVHPEAFIWHGSRMDSDAARLAALKNLKALQNAQQLVLKETKNEIYRLQKEVWPTTLHRGIQSLPDDLVREIFEAGFNSYGYQFHFESYPIELSQVNRRFRTIAMDTPQIWTNLSNLSALDTLGCYIARSKVAGLSIRLFLYLDEDKSPCSVSEFLEITTSHSSRWQSFECFGRIPDLTEDGVYSENYQALLAYPNLDVPHLRNFSWNIFYWNESTDDEGLPITYFKDWNMPQLAHFCGSDALIDASLIGYNLVSVTLELHTQYITWDLDDTLKALAASTHLQHLSFDFAGFQVPSDIKPPKTLLSNLVTLNLVVSGNNSLEVVIQRLSAMQLPILTGMSATVEIDNPTCPDLNHHQSYAGVISAACHYPKLQKFAMDFKGSRKPIAGNVIVTVGKMLPFLQEVTLGGLGKWLYPRRLNAPVSWTVFRVRSSHKTTYESLCRVAVTDPGWGSCKIDIPDERNLSAEAIQLLGDRLIYETCIS